MELSKPEAIKVCRFAIKRFATDNDNASKLTMVAAMEKRGYKPRDDNETAKQGAVR